MLGKLSWSAFPINEPIDLVVSGLMILTIAGILLWLTIRAIGPISGASG
jgi:cytochrome o ubiquinol oxidase subunit I